MKLLEKPKHGSNEWLAKRHRDENGKVVFGASDAPALMGKSAFTTRPELFATKMGTPRISKETEAFRRGNLLEPVLIKEAGDILGIPFHTPDVMYWNNRFVVTLDGVNDAVEPTIIVEAKTTTRFRIREANDLPEEWLWQAWAQQYATQREGFVPSVWFSVLDADQKISVVEAPNNPKAFELLESVSERFAVGIENSEPLPEFDTEIMDASTVAALWKATDTEQELHESDMRWLQDLAMAKDMASEAETIKKFAESQIALVLKNNEIGTYRGVKVISWKEQAGRNSFDTKALQDEHPDIFTKYQKKGKSFRVMRTHKVSGE